MILMSVKTIVIFLIFNLLICSNVFAFQFEYYKWGTPKDQICQILKLKGKEAISPVPSEPETVIYYDKMYGEKCTVFLTFTQKTVLLCYVAITWENKDVSKIVKEAILKEYGQPSQIFENKEKYIWKGTGKCESIMLDATEETTPGTSLIYYGGEFYLKNKDEGGYMAPLDGECSN